MALFNLDDVKALYNASKADGGDEKPFQIRSASAGMFQKGKKAATADNEAGDEDDEEVWGGDDEEGEEDDEDYEEEGEESEGEDLLDALGDGAEKLAAAMEDMFFQKQFKVKIQNVRLQNLERRKRDVMVQFHVGVPAKVRHPPPPAQ